MYKSCLVIFVLVKNWLFQSYDSPKSLYTFEGTYTVETRLGKCDALEFVNKVLLLLIDKLFGFSIKPNTLSAFLNTVEPY